MAKPIAATPKLNANATIKFLQQVAKDLRSPVGPVATPKIEKGIELIKKHASSKSK